MKKLGFFSRRLCKNLAGIQRRDSAMLTARSVMAATIESARFLSPGKQKNTRGVRV